MSDGFAGYRSRLVELLQRKGIRDMAVLRAVATVPRHRFVPAELESRAYDDSALPIGDGQTISQPWVQARACELLALSGRERVLEVGTGSGYQTALLTMLAETVFSVERLARLARLAHETLHETGHSNVSVIHGDGTLGWRPNAPYQGIIVAAAAPAVPAALIQQLTPGGRMVIPISSGDDLQSLTLVVRHDSGNGWEETAIADVRFVPLLGEFGYDPGTRE